MAPLWETSRVNSKRALRTFKVCQQAAYLLDSSKCICESSPKLSSMGHYEDFTATFTSALFAKFYELRNVQTLPSVVVPLPKVYEHIYSVRLLALGPS